jgi:hypothetical protein
MALYTTTFAANASNLLCNVKKDNIPYEASVAISGGFGGGTVTIQASYNGGTTKTTVAAYDGQTAVSATAEKSFYFKLGRGEDSAPIKIYATVTGSTTPTLTVSLADNG